MYLVRRSNGTYHFRLVLSRTLQAALGKKEIHHSLKTRKKRVAAARAKELYHKYMSLNAFKNILVQLPDGTTVDIDHGDTAEDRKTAESLLGSRVGVSATTMQQGDLQGLVDAYLEDIHTTVVTSRTVTETKGALRAYMSLYDSIDHASANGFSDILKKLPPGFDKDDMKALAGQEHPKVLTPKTHNKYIGLLSAFNSWLIRRGHLDHNVFVGLKMKRTVQAHTERESYSPAEVRLLLASTQGLEGFKYWLPRLALYTGCRLNELCQLYLEDVVEVEGLLCLKIQSGSEGQHLKNLSSQRIVPVHPGIADEFRAYVHSLDGSARVFPDLTWTKASNWGGLASKWFARHRKTAGISKPFHSLRHTFAVELMSNRVSDTLISDLLGHSKAGETSRYTGRRPVGQLMDAIKTLKF